MKLIIEKHPEQNKLKQYFKKIESMSERKGINVDELIDAPLKDSTQNIFSINKKQQNNFSTEDF